MQPQIKVLISDPGTACRPKLEDPERRYDASVPNNLPKSFVNCSRIFKGALKILTKLVFYQMQHPSQKFMNSARGVNT